MEQLINVLLFFILRYFSFDFRRSLGLGHAPTKKREGRSETGLIFREK